MKGRHLGSSRSLQRPALLLLLLWGLCQLQSVVSTGHHHNHARPAQQLSTTGPAPAPFQMPTSPPAPPPLFVVPPSYEPSDAPSGLLPFVAPSPLVVPVISNPTQPKLSGLCPFNFTELEDVLIRTAGDCPEPLALYVGSVICCPQLESLFQVSLGQHSVASGYLGLNVTEAAYCFSDTENILSSMGANTTVGDLCSAQPTNLTSGSCPITTVREFEKLVNTTRFLEACQSVDPLKECTEEPICQIVLTNIAIQMAGGLVNTPGTGNEAIMAPGALQVVIDCQNLALAWLASKLGSNDANTVLRNLISCQVNKGKNAILLCQFYAIGSLFKSAMAVRCGKTSTTARVFWLCTKSIESSPYVAQFLSGSTYDVCEDVHTTLDWPTIMYGNVQSLGNNRDP